MHLRIGITIHRLTRSELGIRYVASGRNKCLLLPYHRSTPTQSAQIQEGQHGRAARRRSFLPRRAPGFTRPQFFRLIPTVPSPVDVPAPWTRNSSALIYSHGGADRDRQRARRRRGRVATRQAGRARDATCEQRPICGAGGR
jgi:hypothetical protein